MIQIHIKQPSGFHNLQTFIDQCCRIYCDLLSHYPVRVLQGICKRHMFQFFSFSSTEGTTGSCDQKLLNLRPLFPMKSLENSTVLTVYRKNGNSVLLCQRHNDMSCRYQRLFIGKRNIFSCLDCFNCRTDTDHTDNSRYKDVCLGHTRKLQKSLHTRHNFYIHIRKTDCQVLCRIFIPHCNQLRMKLSCLFFQHFHISSCTDSQHLYIAVSSHYIQGLCTDGTS